MKTNMKSRLFSSDSRLSDLITAHPSLLSLLTRLGLSLGFGDRSIADVCDASGVDTDFFLLICNVYTFNNYVPSTAAIQALMGGQRDTTYSIGEFLHTHSDIEGKLDDLLNIVFKYLPPQVDDDDVLDVVYDILRLSEDLKKHTFIEEKIMVPLVKHLENAILKK